MPGNAARDPAYAADIKLIHTAKKALALTDDSYRAIIWRFSGNSTDSSAKLTGPQRRDVIEHFRTLGFKPEARRPGSVVGGPYRRGGHSHKRQAARPAEPYRAQVGKLQALWFSLYQLGVVRENTSAACEAFVRRHTGIQALRWNDAEDLSRAIECLKGWCQREGYDPQPSKPVPEAPAPQDGRYAPGLIHAQWWRLIRLGAMRHGATAGLDTWLNNQGWPVNDPSFLEDDAADEAIRRLGQWLRRISAVEDRDGGD